MRITSLRAAVSHALLGAALLATLPVTAAGESASSGIAPQDDVASVAGAAPAAADVPVAPASPAPAPGAARRLSPLAAEMRQVLDAERRALDELAARFRGAPDARAALAIQREIERVKRDTEIALLRVQASHARRAGRIESAQRIEAEIESILHPRRAGLAPENREVGRETSTREGGARPGSSPKAGSPRSQPQR